jgi:hypothetical protein
MSKNGDGNNNNNINNIMDIIKIIDYNENNEIIENSSDDNNEDDDGLVTEERETMNYLLENNLVMFEVTLYFNNNPIMYSNYTYPNNIVENLLICNIMNDLTYLQLEDLNHIFVDQVYDKKKLDFMRYGGNEYPLDYNTQFGRIKEFMLNIKANDS